MLIKRISSFVHVVTTRNADVVVAYNSFLRPGTYYSSLSGDIVYLHDTKEFVSAIMTFQKNLSLKKNFFVSVVKKFIVNSNRYIVGEGEKLFWGDTLLISSLKNSPSKYKIFDHHNGKLLTIYLSSNEYMSMIKKRTIISQYFKLVPFTRSVLAPNAIEEPIIKCRNFSAQDAFKDIVSIYCSYLRGISYFPKKMTFSRQSLEIFEKTFVLSVDASMLDLPEVYVHGDLWRGNIIFDGINYYYLDTEDVSKQYFLFDVFMFMVFEAISQDDYGLLKDFLNGTLDSEFSAMFYAIGKKFDPNKREEYLKLYMAILCTLRGGDLHLRNDIRKIIKICEIS